MTEIDEQHARDAVSVARVWTPEQIDALGVRTDLVTACAVLGIGSRTKAYELYRRGELPFPVITAGRRIVCPTAPIRELLGLTPLELAEPAQEAS